jgi:hypothetical protein
VDKKFMKYACPKNHCKFISMFKLKSGFSNPYAHLSSCYGAEKLFELYDEAIEYQAQKGGTIDSHFKVVPASAYNRAMYGLMRFIVMKSLPISYIEDSEFRAISMFKEVISRKTFTRR